MIRNLGSAVLRRVYDGVVRQRLPRKWTLVQENIFVRKQRLLDARDHLAEYEVEECNGLRRVVKPGDHVLIIGGGVGVSTIVAGRAAGSVGRVTVYEAVPEMVELIREAVKANDVPAEVSVVCAAVG